MIKSELIDRISRKFPQLPEKVVAHSINHILETMNSALSHGKRIEIRDFGGFTMRYRAARTAHNPKTGAKVVTAAKHTPHFKPGKELRERVDASKTKPIKEEVDSDEE